LQRSTLHVDEFLRISTLSRGLSGPHRLPGTDIDELVALAKADLAAGDRVIHATPRGVAPTPSRRPQSWRLLAACAVLVAVLGVAATLHARWLDSTRTYSTALGELRSITLEDGSIVELNTQSSVRTRFSPTERRVELLSGEAVFKVAKQPARPFRVVAGAAQIVAVGTAFNVYAQSARTIVTVLEGRVRVEGQKRDQDQDLARGEQAIIDPHARIKTAVLADPQQVTSWTQRRLVFDETSLTEAAAEFARYNARTIRIGDAQLGEMQITGFFDATDPASLVQFVEAYGHVTVQADRHGWTLTRAD
jgi:transmembrane sensor